MFNLTDSEIGVLVVELMEHRCYDVALQLTRSLTNRQVAQKFEALLLQQEGLRLKIITARCKQY